jgi:hypothetical protein
MGEYTFCEMDRLGRLIDVLFVYSLVDDSYICYKMTSEANGIFKFMLRDFGPAKAFACPDQRATLLRASFCLTTKHPQRTNRPEQCPPAVLSTMYAVKPPREHSRAMHACLLVA